LEPKKNFRGQITDSYYVYETVELDKVSKEKI
jgi:hypothetical protein